MNTLVTCNIFTGYHLPWNDSTKAVVDFVLFAQPLLYFPYPFEPEEVFKSVSTFCVPYEEAQRVWEYLQFQGYYAMHFWNHFAHCQWHSPDAFLHTRYTNLSQGFYLFSKANVVLSTNRDVCALEF